jgi:hypothetical membrane protein
MNKDKYLTAAGILWISNLQFFLVQLLVARSFIPSFSIKNNTISDLGNTVCGPYGSREVCSPDHLWMNLSFVILGITMIAGSILLIRNLPKNKYQNTGLIFMALSGVGTILAAIFPENSISSFHILGAALSFIFGNMAVIIVSASKPKFMSELFQNISILMACIALILLLFMVTNNYLWLGLGGIERIVAYVQTIWMTSVGVMIVRSKSNL